MIHAPSPLGDVATGDLLVVAATGAEARPVRRRLRGSGIDVHVAGMGLARWRNHPAAALVVCGLAGGLDARVASGTLVIPDAIARGDAEPVACDPGMVGALRAAAARLGLAPHPGPIVTVDHVVTGAERAAWAARGYAAADMESALVFEGGRRVAAVRVVLDSPSHEISPAWAHPARAATRPWLWGEAWWLARTAPRLCDLVAAVVAEAFATTPRDRGPGMFAPPARPGA